MIDTSNDGGASRWSKRAFWLLSFSAAIGACDVSPGEASDAPAPRGDGPVANPGLCQRDEDCGPRPEGGLCVGRNACVAGECKWVAGVSCQSSSADPCLASTCLPATGTCFLAAAPVGTACILAECNSAVGTCVDAQCRAPVGETPTCADGNPCTLDTCAAGAGCRNDVVPSGTACPSPDPCVEGTTCDGATCGGGQPRVCDDGNTCTDDRCQSGAGCRFEPVPSFQKKPCEDGNICAGPDYCKGGKCVSEYYNKNEGFACDDQDPCTLTTQCGGGVCRQVTLEGQPSNLPPGTPCPITWEDDRCFERAECHVGGFCDMIPKPNGTECPDGCGSGNNVSPGTCLNGWCECN